MPSPYDFRRLGAGEQQQLREYFRSKTGRYPNDQEMIDISAQAMDSTGMDGLRRAIDNSPQVSQYSQDQHTQELIAQRDKMLSDWGNLYADQRSKLEPIAEGFAGDRSRLQSSAEALLKPLGVGDLTPQEKSTIDLIREVTSERGAQDLSSVTDEMQARGIVGSDTEALARQRARTDTSRSLVQQLQDFLASRESSRLNIAGGLSNLAGQNLQGELNTRGDISTSYGRSGDVLSQALQLLQPDISYSRGKSDFYESRPIVEAYTRMNREAQKKSLLSRILGGVADVAGAIPGIGSVAKLGLNGIKSLAGGGGDDGGGYNAPSILDLYRPARDSYNTSGRYY